MNHEIYVLFYVYWYKSKEILQTPFSLVSYQSCPRFKYNFLLFQGKN